jgi:Fe-S cluster biogenesis protein NfuA
MQEISSSVKAAVEKALEDIRPFLNNDGGDITLVDITPDWVVRVRLHGSCRECSMKLMTMRAGILEAVRKSIPEVKDVQEFHS